jgi:sec-independent protein translocase protein TatB
MPGIGWAELLILAIIAIVVVGPRDLPGLMRQFGKWFGKARRLAAEFQASIDEMGREAELDELRKEVEKLKKEATPGPDAGDDAAKAADDKTAPQSNMPLSDRNIGPSP